MQNSYTIDYKLVLEYLKVILSFPTVTLVITGAFFWLFKEELRVLFGRMRNFEAAGAKIGFSEVDKIVEAAVEISVENKSNSLNNMPEGKEKIAKAAEIEEEKTILREKIKKAYIRTYVGFSREIEVFLDAYIDAQELSPNLSLGGVPDEYFEKMNQALLAVFPRVGGNSAERQRRDLAGYWVRHKIMSQLNDRQID